MSSFTDDLNRAVRILVRSVLGLGENDVRKSDQTAASGQQSAPYATVRISMDEEDGTASRSYEHDDIDDVEDLVEVSMVPERFTASVQFWGATPSPAQLRGAAVSDDVDDYTGVTAGALSLPIDGAVLAVSGIDLSTATTMDEVASLLQARVAAALAGVTVVWTSKRFIVTSPTTGQASAAAPSAVSATSTLLGLTAAAGAVGSDNKSGIAKPSTEAFDRARRLKSRIELSIFVELMQKLGIGFESASPARNLAALASGGAFESRGQIDLTFSVISRETASAVDGVLDVDPTQIQIAMLAQSPDGVIHNIEPEVTP